MGGAKTSNKEIEWLNSIESNTGKEIERQYRIPGIGDVDDYITKDGTVLKFHGDYWHGNPNKYNLYSSNRRTDNPRSYGELFMKTLDRDSRILDHGYNLIVKWETDFPEYSQILYDYYVTNMILNYFN